MSAPQNINIAGKTAPLTIRRATPADAAIAGQICFDAFGEISTRHNFTPDIPSPGIATHVLSMMFGHPGFFCVVAEENGRIVGSNSSDERGPIAGIGPITIDPAAQNRGIGAQLMRAVMDHAAERNLPGIRLLQAGFHMRSLSLYTKLGFTVREPIVCMNGTPLQRELPGYHVRAATPNDLSACEALCRRVHGHERTGELRDAIAPQKDGSPGAAIVAESRGRIVAYATVLGFFGHTVAESNEDLQALIAWTPQFHGPGFLMPMRNAELFRWCLAQGLRATQPLNLMSIGLYNDPAGAYLPSISY